MIATEKALTAVLKDISTALHTIGAGLALELPKELTAALQRKDLLEDWFSKAFALGKKLRGEAISESNRHKRLVKRIYTVFKKREPWISMNES